MCQQAMLRTLLTFNLERLCINLNDSPNRINSDKCDTFADIPRWLVSMESEQAIFTK